MLYFAYKLPLLGATYFILGTLLLFMFSPMAAQTPNLFFVLVYACLVVLSFWFGYILAYRVYVHRYRERRWIVIHRGRFNLLLIALLLVPILVYSWQLRLAISYFGFPGLTSIFYDLGGNYFQKNELLDEIGSAAGGLFYSALNLLSFALIAGYVSLVVYWDRASLLAKLLGVSAAVIQLLFFLSIGTMSGVFYLAVCVVSGLIIQFISNGLSNEASLSFFRSRIRRAVIWGMVLVAAFFALMVVVLSSRSASIIIPARFKYDDDSLVYTIFGEEAGNGFGLALAYVSQGWHGLGNAFSVDFKWTYGLSIGRAISGYYYRFAGVEFPPQVLAYPVRQEAFSGYPAYVHWHTIFPWLASDVTFAGALVMTGIFAFMYGYVWLDAIKLRCPISASFFALLTIGVLFITANSQILDNKLLLLAFVAFIFFFGFRAKFRKLL